MDIELPSDNDQEDDSVFGGRIDAYEAYWLYVDGVRYVGPALEQSEATKQDEDRSPLACHYNHFYEKKEEYKDRCKDLPGSLPKYKDHFEEPRGDVRKIPEHRLSDLGLGQEGDDPIWLPPEYELPDVWENDLDEMDEPELRDLVEKLREEKKELKQERDDLREKLKQVRQSLTSFLDDESMNKSDGDSAAYTCNNCGRAFESRAARNGHKPHCDGVSSGNRASDDNASRQDLAQLAEDLPEILEEQSDTDHESAEEELKNLNHLLQGSL
ncbi:hypothetical protein GRX03_10635 [Halovenus sp. WSH3]|uniref:C2H2-type domain-containing protein n=1 Tax=Halovenus carboxidivorans TaxID=2692199 RepID=A0A6B0T903_9EURY|nr:hypothetical protein [Halovenus carboxidivorans]MXR52053.1 hypothetical protein [Halovenus carboxidivorans]